VPRQKPKDGDTAEGGDDDDQESGNAPTITDDPDNLDNLDNLAAEALAQDGFEAMPDIPQPLADLVADAEFFEELAERLPENAAAMDTGALTESLARGLFNARLAGALAISTTGAGNVVRVRIWPG
jgi:hypothetical protein